VPPLRSGDALKSQPKKQYLPVRYTKKCMSREKEAEKGKTDARACRKRSQTNLMGPRDVIPREPEKANGRNRVIEE
jgi:hypothetical protein